MTTMTLEQVRDALRGLLTRTTEYLTVHDALEMADAIDAHLAKGAHVPDGIADELLDAWRSIAHVSGSALLSGEKKAQTSEQRELVYGMACKALIATGNDYYELTGKNPDFDAAPQPTLSAQGSAVTCMHEWIDATNPRVSGTALCIKCGKFDSLSNHPELAS